MNRCVYLVRKVDRILSIGVLALPVQYKGGSNIIHRCSYLFLGVPYHSAKIDLLTTVIAFEVYMSRILSIAYKFSITCD